MQKILTYLCQEFHQSKLRPKPNQKVQDQIITETRNYAMAILVYLFYLKNIFIGFGFWFMHC